jgi:hypothetical protein
MQFIKLDITDDEYRQLVIDTIGQYIPHVKHDISVCKNDDDTVAVFNYFTFCPDTLFLHYTWFSEKYRVKIMKLQYWTGFCEYVKAMGFKRIMGIIDSKNIPALVWALKTGWEITGARKDVKDNLLVDIVKEL